MTSSYHQSARSLRNQEKSEEILLSWSSVDTTFSSESTHHNDKNKGANSLPIPFFALSLPLSQDVDIVGKANLAYDAVLFGSLMLKKQIKGGNDDPFAIAIAGQITHGELGFSERGGGNLVVYDLGIPILFSWFYLNSSPSLFPAHITLGPQYLYRRMSGISRHPPETLHYFGSNIGFHYSRYSLEGSYLRTRRNSTQTEISIGLKI